jgi:hypothetical protein
MRSRRADPEHVPLELAFDREQLGGAPHDDQLELVGGERLPRRHAMAVDRLELEERVEALEGDEIDVQRVEDLVEVDLQARQHPRIETRVQEEDPDVEIRTRGRDWISSEDSLPVVPA